MKRRYSREGSEVLKNGKHFALAKNTVVAAMIVQALEIAEGRIPEVDDDAK